MMHIDALKSRIHAIAKEKKLPFNAFWKHFLLERFLVRLARSTYRDKLIFKGGFLLAYLIQIGRETVDLDFLLTRLKSEEKTLKKAFDEIASIEIPDGFSFTLHKIEPLSHPHMTYPGFRVTLKCSILNLRDMIQVDIGVGDDVEPQEQELKLLHYRKTALFEESISLDAYPIETIFAEKLETAIALGVTNTRMKDYHDLIAMIRNSGKLDMQKLKGAIAKTFAHRKTAFRLIDFAENEMAILQGAWNAHLRDLGDKALELALPQNFASGIEEINRYLAPITQPKPSLARLITVLKGEPLLAAIKEALTSGAEVNDDSQNGHRPLQLALKKGATEVARLLIEHGADLNHRDKSRQTPLEAAINHGQFENAKHLIKKGAHFNKYAPNLGFHYPNLYQFFLS